MATTVHWQCQQKNSGKVGFDEHWLFRRGTEMISPLYWPGIAHLQDLALDYNDVMSWFFLQLVVA